MKKEKNMTTQNKELSLKKHAEGEWIITYDKQMFHPRTSGTKSHLCCNCHLHFLLDEIRITFEMILTNEISSILQESLFDSGSPEPGTRNPELVTDNNSTVFNINDFSGYISFSDRNTSGSVASENHDLSISGVRAVRACPKPRFFNN